MGEDRNIGRTLWLELGFGHVKAKPKQGLLEIFDLTECDEFAWTAYGTANIQFNLSLSRKRSCPGQPGSRFEKITATHQLSQRTHSPPPALKPKVGRRRTRAPSVSSHSETPIQQGVARDKTATERLASVVHVVSKFGLYQCCIAAPMLRMAANRHTDSSVSPFECISMVSYSAIAACISHWSTIVDSRQLSRGVGKFEAGAS